MRLLPQPFDGRIGAFYKDVVPVSLALGAGDRSSSFLSATGLTMRPASLTLGGAESNQKRANL